VWNTRAQTAEELAHEIAVLHRHCNTAGRDPAQIRKTAAGCSKTPLTISTDICERRNATPCTST